MSVYFVQHGKSAPKEVDPERGLTSEGTEEVVRVAKRLSGAGIRVAGIWHSGKTRAAQTAELFARELEPAGGVSAREGIDPLDDVAAFADALDPSSDAMFVGHLPFLERLVSYLLTNDSDGRVVAFRNGAVVTLDHDDETARWVLAWAIVPDLC